MINLNIYLNKIVLGLSICLMLLFTIGWMFAPTSDLSNANQLDQDISSAIGSKEDLHFSSDFENIGIYEKSEVSESDIIEQSEEDKKNKKNQHKNVVKKAKAKSNVKNKQDELHAKSEIKTIIEKDNIELDLALDLDDYEIEYYYAEEDIPFIELDGSIVVANDKYD